MEDIRQVELKKRYTAAANSFIDKIKDDINTIAVIICGSLAYDTVWEKSDIDMVVLVRDQNLNSYSYCLVEDGITINAQIINRSAFKRGIERNIGGSIMQAFFAKGNIVYTTDDSLYEYFEDIKKMGRDDIELSVLRISCELVDTYHKCSKWLNIKKDLIYAQYYILKTAGLIASIELCINGEPPIREAIRRVHEINPDLITPFYEEAMSHTLTKNEIEDKLKKIEGYLNKCVDIIKRPIIEYMSDQEIKTVAMLAKHFNLESHFIIGILDFLFEKGIIEKVSQTIKITPKSRLAVEEIGYLYIP